MTEKQKKTKQPIYGMYFPSEFPTASGQLLINGSIDIPKLLEHHSDIPEEILKLIQAHYNCGGKKYIKFCISKNRFQDKDGNLYFPFLNTYSEKV